MPAYALAKGGRKRKIRNTREKLDQINQESQSNQTKIRQKLEQNELENQNQTRQKLDRN